MGLTGRFWKRADGKILGVCEEMPALSVTGRTIEEAKRALRDALECWVDSKLPALECQPTAESWVLRLRYEIVQAESAGHGDPDQAALT